MNEFEPKTMWFTADLHFWHGGILSERIGLPSRARWSSVEEMNIDLVREWRDTVGPHDAVYHLGDLFFRCGKAKVLRTLQDLSGFWIFLLPGNHDGDMLRKLERQGELPSNVRLLPPTPVMLDRRIDGRPVFMHHYPPSRVEEWSQLPEEAILLHGHRHGQQEQEEPERALDVGWDNHERFLSLDDLRAHFGERTERGAPAP